MFEFLKNYFRRRSLRRHACNEPTGIVPLGEVRTVAVFLDAEDPSFESCRQELQAFFSENNLNGDFFITDITKKGLKKEYNWFGQPTAKTISRLQGMRADICISLLRDASFPVEFLVKCIPSRFKIGRIQLPGGRCAEPPSLELSESIARHGIRVGRMKTGTPVRIDARSVDFSLMTVQPGDTEERKFSYLDSILILPKREEAETLGNYYLSNSKSTSSSLCGRTEVRTSLPSLPCWITYTNDAVHERLRQGLPDSPLYNGQIQSIGPRYCPSIETKLVTFPDKDQHQLFLEPEGTNTQEYYLNGFSSSLPIEVQIEALRLIPAFRNIEIYRPGYAIEYDFFDPTQLHHSLESRVISGLYLAGQVNGTTGYEEAAGQGLLAGINAARNCTNQEPLILQRDEAYIGVLIDDLVCKGVDEPYRMFTSRAEYRILLRQDNADARLTRKGYSMGIASSKRLRYFEEKEASIQRIIDFADNYSVKMQDVNGLLEQLGTAPLTRGCKLMELLGRPQLTIDNLAPALPRLKEVLDNIQERRAEIVEEAEIQIKYQGYIHREVEQAEKMHRLENIRIRGRFDYATLQSISTEGRQKLISHNPETLAQASRIPGVSPSDINVLLVLLGR